MSQRFPNVISFLILVIHVIDVTGIDIVREIRADQSLK